MTQLMERHTANLALPQVDQAAILRHLNINPNDPAAQALIMVCQRYDLDPILKHALLIKGRLYVTRDGLMHVAHRSGKFDGMEVLEQGETASHYTAKVSVWRKDMGRPFSYIGRYPKSGQIAKDYGPEMAVKVAEVMALRRAFDVALGAAEERWDDEAQREMAQADNPAPQAAPAARNVDVTREVAQAAGTQPHTLPDPELEGKLQKWATAIGEMAARVRKVAPEQDVQDVLSACDWRRDLGAASATYDALKALGLLHAPKKAAPSQADVQDAEFTPDPTTEPAAPGKASHEQIGQLQAAAKAMGADTSEKRAALWGWMLEHDAPIPTATLNGEEAEHALKYLAKNNPEQRAECVIEALKKFPLPVQEEALFTADGTPF